MDTSAGFPSTWTNLVPQAGHKLGGQVGGLDDVPQVLTMEPFHRFFFNWAMKKPRVFAVYRGLYATQLYRDYNKLL